MASSIQLLRSTNAQERPFPNNLLEGQPALNLNSTEPGLFFKATDGSLVKVGPAAITADGSPPNASATGLAGNTVGEMWLDKSVVPPVLKIYDGATWVDAGSGSSGGSNVSLLRWTKTATGGETSLSGPDDSGQQLAYTPGLEQLYLNGVLLERGTDYVGTNGTSFSNLAALTAGDIIVALIYSPFSVETIPDGSITNEKLANNTITSAKIDEISSSKVTYTSTQTGAVSRTVQSKLNDLVSVEDFGVVVSGSVEPSYAIAQQNTIALNQLLATNNSLILPKGTIYITDTLSLRDDSSIKGYGFEKDSYTTGSVIRAHSGFNMSNPMVLVDRWHILSSFMLIGIPGAATKAEQPAYGIKTVTNKTSIDMRDVHVEYCQTGFYLDQLQNSLIQGCDAFYCPVACWHILNCENTVFLNITSNLSGNFMGNGDNTTRNVIIENDQESGDAVAQRSRNLTFIGGIHERGGDVIEHVLEQKGKANGLLFIGGEYGSGGYHSTMNFEADAQFINTKWAPGHSEMLITSASSFGLIDAANPSLGYKPLDNNGAQARIVSPFDSGAGLSGRSGQMIIQNYFENEVVVKVNYERNLPASISPSVSDSGATLSIVSADYSTGTRAGIQISGSTDLNFGFGFEAASGYRLGYVSDSPGPAVGWPAFLVGRTYKIELIISGFNANTTGAIVRVSSVGKRNNRRTLATLTGDGFHSFEVTTQAITDVSDDTVGVDQGNFFVVPNGPLGSIRQLTLSYFKAEIT